MCNFEGNSRISIKYLLNKFFKDFSSLTRSLALSILIFNISNEILSVRISPEILSNLVSLLRQCLSYSR